MSSTVQGSLHVLEFDHVTRWYGSIAALMDVTFHVGCEVVGLVGRNGVGKSTLMKLAAGLLRPSQGVVRVLGHDAATRQARAQIGFCPDVDRMYESISGLRFVSWMLRYHGYSRRDADARASEVLVELGMAAHMQRPLGEYSKGMRQRVRLAQALAHEPQFVLLDEPMTGLDPLARRELSATIRSLPARGIGVLVSSHVLHELEAVVDRVVLVHEGRLMADGRIGELRELVPELPQRVRVVGERVRELAASMVGWPQVQAVRLVDDAIEVTVNGYREFLRELTALGAANGGSIHEVAPLDDNLASVFGYLVG